MKRLWLSAALLLAFSLAFAACGGGEKEAAPAAPAPAAKSAYAEPAAALPAPAPKALPEAPAPAAKAAPAPHLDVGVISWTTGALASWGIPFSTGIQIAADEVNAEGGLLVGGKRYIIDVDVQDATGASIPVTLSIAEKFVSQDKKRFILDPGDPIVGVVEPLTNPRKIIHIAGTFDREPCKNVYTFCTLLSPRETSPGFFQAVRELHPEVKSVVYIAVNHRYDLNSADWTEAAAKLAGFDWKGVQIYDYGTIDFLATANGAVAKKADMIILGGCTGDCPSIVKSLQELRYKGVLSANFGVFMPQLLYAFKGEEQKLEGFFGVEEGHYLVDPDLDWLRGEYEKRLKGTGYEPAGIIPNYHELVMLMAGLKAAGTVDDPDAIAKAMETVKVPNKFYPGDPLMSFGGKNYLGRPHQLNGALALNIIKGGKIVTLKTFLSEIE